MGEDSSRDRTAEQGHEQAPERAGDRSGETDWERRRRLAEVFGDVLPETTRDERDPETGRSRGEDPGERWLKDQVPPHHG